MLEKRVFKIISVVTQKEQFEFVLTKLNIVKCTLDIFFDVCHINNVRFKCKQYTKRNITTPNTYKLLNNKHKRDH